MVSNHRFGLFLAFALGASCSGCARLPVEHGIGDVRAKGAERGYSLPDEIDSDRDPITRLPAGRPLLEADAVRLAFLNNPRIRGEYARLGLSGADVLQAGRLRNPTFDGSFFFSSASGLVSRYDLGLTQSLVELLMLPARARFSRGEFERAKLQATDSLLELAAEVQDAYYDAVGARQTAAMRKTIADGADRATELTARFKSAGNITSLELSVSLAGASQARLDAEKAEADATASKTRLNSLMGLPPDAEWQVTEALPLPVATEDTLDELQTLAESKRADLEAARRAVTLLEDSLGITRSYRYLGDVQVGVQYERDSDRNRLLGPSLTLQLPIFNQGQAAILRAESQLGIARAELDAKVLEVANGVQGAYDRVTSARKRIDRLRTETVPLRQQIVAQTQERMNYMLVGVFDALRVRQDEYAAYQQYLEAIRDYWKARVALSRAVGSRLPSDDDVDAARVAPEYPTPPPVTGAPPMDEGQSHPWMPGMEDMGRMPAMSGMHAARPSKSRQSQPLKDKLLHGDHP